MIASDIIHQTSLGRVSAQDWGELDARPVVLIPGVTLNSADWPKKFVSRLVEDGCRVVAPDLPDSGHSERLEREYGLGELAKAVMEFGRAEFADRPIHWVGVSMGSLIAQLLPFTEETADSVTLLMASSGFAPDGIGKWTALVKLLGIRHNVDKDKLFFDLFSLRSQLASCHTERDLVELRRRTMASIERGLPYGAGPRRQLKAITNHYIASGTRSEFSPAPLIIHGEKDPLLPLSGAEALQRRLRGSRLVTIPRFGHEFVNSRLDEVVTPMLEHFTSPTCACSSI